MHIWYKFLTYLFYPFSHIYLFFRKLKKKEHPTRYKEKLAHISLSRGEGFVLWCHVASVGEAMSILPLIENFEQDEKIKKILITTITLSSAEVLQKRFGQNKKVIHQFLPLDIPKFTYKFLNHWSPNLAIFIDSEIWPNLIFNIKKKDIPLLLVNGRITKKTFLRWSYFKNFSKEIFEKFNLCLAGSNETENFLRILGAKNIKNYGNLKFSKTKLDRKTDLNTEILKKIENRKIWCAASTHPSEEMLCGKTHLELKKTFSNILTVIIPRHVSRAEGIVRDLSKLNLKVTLYSEFEKIDNDTDVLLINAYGESLKFYNLSKCVFIGKSTVKSLIKNSGQNPIEAARLGCKIFHGPHVNNFKEIYEYLKSVDITDEIFNSLELSQKLVKELKNDKINRDKIKEKIEDYGLNTLNNVLKEIKIYINS